MKKTWKKPELVEYGTVEDLTQQTRPYCLPFARVQGYVKHCGFGDAVSQNIGLDLGLKLT